MGSYYITTPFRDKNARVRLGRFLWDISLTMSYFHTGTRNIIGAEAFHCPVRDGKEWDHLAMVVRHNRRPLHFGSQANSQSRPLARESDLDRALRCEERFTRLTRLDDGVVKVIGSSRTSN